MNSLRNRLICSAKSCSFYVRNVGFIGDSCLKTQMRSLNRLAERVNTYQTNNCTQLTHPSRTSVIYVQSRHKSNKKSKKQTPAASGDESGDEDSDDDLSKFSETGGKDKNLMKLTLSSLRADLIIKSALKISRNKIETIFYDSKIRVDGKKILKKSMTIKDGAEIDVIKGVSPNNPEHIIVSRVEVLSTKVDNEKQRIIMVVRAIKTLAIENYPDTDVFKESENKENQQ